MPIALGAAALALVQLPFGAPASAALVTIRLPDDKADLVERGTSGADKILGTGDSDIVRAGSGDDEVRTGKGRDRIWGGPGFDRIWSGEGDDRVIVAGDPFYEGRDVSALLGDTVDCGPGRDTVVVDPNDKTVNCEVTRLVAPGQTPHIDRVMAEIRAMEERTGSQSSEGLLWELTRGNSLPGMGGASPEWVSRTSDCWGATAACDSSGVQQQLTSTIRRIIGSAETVVDISSLAPLAYDGFRQAIIDGAADAQRAGRRPLIRMMWGRSPAAPFSDSKLRALQRDVQAAAPDLRVVGAVMANTVVTNGYSWNHSKIVAADSKVAWASGINLWADSYLQSRNPVTDLGVVVEGPAAANANEFLDVLWKFSCRREGFGPRYNITIVPSKGGAGGCPATAAPAAPAPVGDIPVLAVGRAGYINTGLKPGTKDPREVSKADRRDSGCIIPPLPNPMNGDPEWDGNNPSDTALRALVESAETKIVISQQHLVFDCAKDPSYDVRLIDAIARKVRDGIPVTIVISNQGAKITLFEQYGGDPAGSLKVVMKRLAKIMGSESLAREAARRSLVVAPFRFSSLDRWPGSTPPALHAKVIAVDDQAVLVGSQNAYPNQLQEFGYIIEDSRAMADMKREFLDPLEYWGRKAALPVSGKGDQRTGSQDPSPPAGNGNGTGTGPLPGEGTPWVVSVGDSYLSGEGGRWAGNSNRSPDLVDALGPSAYFDNDEGTAEQVKDCHRAKSAPIHIGSDLAQSINFACSGASTSTVARDRNGQFKPGLDFYSGPEGVGQLTMLRDFARTHRVKMIAVSIGLNDFNYGPITEACVRSFLTSLSIAPRYCRDDREVRKNFTKANVEARTDDIRRAYARIGEAMKQAGYEPDDYTVVATKPPLPIAPSEKVRYREQGLQRQSTGGCGIYNADIDQLVKAAFPAVSKAIDAGSRASGIRQLRRLELDEAFAGHRLCETGVDVVENGPGSWSAEGAVDRSEWVTQIRTASTLIGPYQLLEGFHPNYWGQLAMRTCLRWAYRALSVEGSPLSGRCVQNGGGLNSRKAPPMKLVE